MSMDKDAVWSVLVECAGARESDRDQFMMYWPECREFRFCGLLGLGGKVWSEDYDRPVRVSCYREDETPERVAIIASVNHQFALRAQLVEAEAKALEYAEAHFTLMNEHRESVLRAHAAEARLARLRPVVRWAIAREFEWPAGAWKWLTAADRAWSLATPKAGRWARSRRGKMSERQDEMRAEAVASIAGSAEAFAFHWDVKASFRCQQEWQGGATAEQWWPVSEEQLHAMIHEAFATLTRERDGLLAHVETLKEVGEHFRLRIGASSRIADAEACDRWDAACASTPAQSLAAVEARVAERCAEIVDAWDADTLGQVVRRDEMSAAIRREFGIGGTK